MLRRSARLAVEGCREHLAEAFHVERLGEAGGENPSARSSCRANLGEWRFDDRRRLPQAVLGFLPLEPRASEQQLRCARRPQAN